MNQCELVSFFQKKEESMMDNKKNEDRNTLYIGKKPIMTYVLALMSSSEKEITLAARGRFMAKAIDVYEVFKNKTQFAKECKATFTSNTVKMEDRNVSELLLKISWK